MLRHLYQVFFASLFTAMFLAAAFFAWSIYRSQPIKPAIFHSSHPQNRDAMRNVVRMQPGPLPVSPVSPVALGPRLYQQEVEEESPE